MFCYNYYCKWNKFGLYINHQRIYLQLAYSNQLLVLSRKILLALARASPTCSGIPLQCTVHIYIYIYVPCFKHVIPMRPTYS